MILVCIYLSLFVYSYICMYLSLSICICMYVCMYLSFSIHIHVCIQLFLFIYMYVSISFCLRSRHDMMMMIYLSLSVYMNVCINLSLSILCKKRELFLWFQTGINIELVAFLKENNKMATAGDWHILHKLFLCFGSIISCNWLYSTRCCEQD